MSKDWLCVFIGDLHVLSHTGLVIPGSPIKSADNRPYSASPRQEWLYRCWRNLQSEVERLSDNFYIALMFGGDGIDGPGHHRTKQTFGNAHDARKMTCELLFPFVQVASAKYGLTGTDAHVGEGGEEDVSVADELNLDVREAWELEFDGKKLLWAHDCVKVGQKRNTIDNGMISMAKDISDECAYDPTRFRPDLIVGHHVHRSPKEVTVRGITVVPVGCWQLATPWAMSKFPFKSVDVGAMFWKPSTHKVHRHLYAQVRQPVVVQKPIKAYDTPKR